MNISFIFLQYFHYYLVSELRHVTISLTIFGPKFNIHLTYKITARTFATFSNNNLLLFTFFFSFSFYGFIMISRFKIIFNVKFSSNTPINILQVSFPPFPAGTQGLPSKVSFNYKFFEVSLYEGV